MKHLMWLLCLTSGSWLGHHDSVGRGFAPWKGRGVFDRFLQSVPPTSVCEKISWLMRHTDVLHKLLINNYLCKYIKTKCFSNEER